MKVLVDTHMLNQQNTGIGRYWLNLVRHLIELNDSQLQLVLYGGKVGIGGSFEKFSPLATNGLYRVGAGFNSAIQKHKPALIHVNNFAPLIKSVPTVVTVHDICFKSVPATFSAKSFLAFQFFFERSLRQADAIICVSHTVRQQVLNCYNIDSGKVHVIYEGVDPCFKKKYPKQYSKKVLQNVGVRHPFFLVVGGFEKRKNILPIVRAFLKLSQSKKKTQLVFVGHDDSLRSYLIRRFSENNVIDVVTLGYVKDDILALLYQSARALLFNSLCEGFGLPLVEAMSLRLPIVCNDIPIFREIARDAAIYVKEERALLKAMSELVGNSDLCHKLGKKGLMRSRLFSWQRAAKQTLALYEKVVSNSS